MPERSAPYHALPGYPLAHIPALKQRLLSEGVDVIDLGAGDADLLPPPGVLAALKTAVDDPAMSRYGFQLGLVAFRQAVAAWMHRRFGVEVDPMSHVLPLIGSKEGIAHLPLAYLNPGDAAIVPDPGYLAYAGGVILAGGEAVRIPLRKDRGFLLDFDEVPLPVRERAKLLYLNYPNNPTTAVGPVDYLRRAVAFCSEHDLVLVYDNAYSEIAFDGYRPPSIFEIEGAWDVAIEFHSLSKTYNMTGWRLGWSVANPDITESLSRTKTFLDTGPFLALQAAGARALDAWTDWVPANVATFQRRRDALVVGLAAHGWAVEPPKATMYVWAPVPEGETSVGFCTRVLDETGVVILPGDALGAAGEGFFRVALTQDEARLSEAASRIGRQA